MMTVQRSYTMVGAYCADCEVLAGALDRDEWQRVGGEYAAYMKAQELADEHNERKHQNAV